MKETGWKKLLPVWGMRSASTTYKIIYQNQSIKSLAGDHLGEYCYKAYHHKDEVCANCPVAKTLIDGLVHSSVRDLITDEGKLYMEIISSPLRNAQGEITGSIEVARNITARRQAYNMLHKLRAAMVRPDRDGIGGEWPVEVDEKWVGGATQGEGRGVHHKTLVVGAVEVRPPSKGFWS